MKTTFMKSRLLCALFGGALALSTHAQDWNLVWSDEFDTDGKPNEKVWSYEHGFARNNEAQWYQPDNAICQDGLLIIEGRQERVKNPEYEAESYDWRKNRKYARYTSSSIKTQGKKEFLYGRFEIRARIPVGPGAWPAFWTLGTDMEWPSCGEVDIMEFYRQEGKPVILANTAWGTDQRWMAHWDSKAIALKKFLNDDPDWASKFHVWRMDWDEHYIRLYLDNELLNETDLSKVANGKIGKRKNPFHQPHYMLINLALGGNNGGYIDDAIFPIRYEVDYVRVYQK